MLLEIPATAPYALLAESCLEQALALTRLSADQQEGLLSVVRQSLQDMLEHSYPAGQPGPVRLEMLEPAGSVTVKLRDWGLPSHRPAAPTHPSIEEIRVQSMAPGIEVELSCHVEVRPSLEVGPVSISGEGAVARRMTPEDAPGVADVIYLTYGASYPFEDIYHPERLIELNRQQLIVTSVVVDPEGRVLGTQSMERRDPSHQVFESGIAAVLPGVRQQHLIQRLAEVAWKEVQALGCVGMTSSTVTTHPYSQKIVQHSGFKVCGLHVGVGPVLDFKGIATGVQRESLVEWGQNFIGGWDAEIYAPPRHQAMIHQLLQRLGFRVSQGNQPASSESGVFSHHVVPRFPGLFVQVQRLGPDLVERLRTLVHAFDRQNITYSRVILPLTQPGLPQVVADLEAAGFFFNAVQLGTGKGDAQLYLQRLFGATVDLDQLVLDCEASREMRDYVKACAPAMAVG
jgi:hypothetical protein